MLCSTAVFAKEPAKDTQELIPTDQQKYFIPVRDAVESNSGVVLWDAETMGVLIEFNDLNYVFDVRNGTITHADKTTPLEFPPFIIDGVTYAHYDTVSFLFDDGNALYSPMKKQVVSMIYSMMTALNVPAYTLSFVDADADYTWIQNFGYANIAEKTRVTSDTNFSIASLSKTFTALAIMQLVEDGLIDLDAKVTTYLPEFKLAPHPIHGGNSDNVTVRMLLNHSSGIYSDIYNNFYSKNAPTGSYHNDFLDNFSAFYMMSEENTRIVYSNAGYTLLGNIISAVNGETKDYAAGYINYVTEKLLLPMEMNNSSFMMANKTSPLAASYSTSILPQMADLYPNAFSAGGMFSSAKDMSHAIKMLLNEGTYATKTIVSSDSITKMSTPSTVNDPLNFSLKYGFGLYRTLYDGVDFVGHGGDVDFFHSDMELSLENNLGIFVSANSGSSMTAQAFIALTALHYAIADKTGVAYVSALVTDAISGYDTKTMKEFEGFYNILGKMEINDVGNVYFTDINIECEKVSDNEFTFPGIGAISFWTVDGEDIILFGTMANIVMLSQKVNPTAANEDFGKFVGTYVAVPASESDLPVIGFVQLLLDANGNAVFGYSASTGSGSAYLEKIDDTHYYLLGNGRNTAAIVSIIDANGTINIEFFGTAYAPMPTE